MRKMNERRRFLREIAENLMLLTQLGFSIAAPPVLCLLAAVWLRGRFSLGPWVVIAALFLGLGGSGVNVWKTYRMLQRRWDRHDEGDSGAGDARRGKR